MADKSASKAKAVKPAKKYDFSLTLPGLISFIGGGVLVLTFFFIMGILIGRGYRPESDVPQLAVIMPQKAHGQAVSEEVSPGILKPEELEYPERLKASPEKVLEESAEIAPAPKPKKPAPAPKKEQPKAKAEDAPIKPEVFTPTAPQSGEKVYDYVYQAAAFRKPEMADNFSQRLVNAGLRTDIQAVDAGGKIWHRVLVLHHGTPSSTNDMKATLARFGVKRPLIKSKTLSQ